MRYHQITKQWGEEARGLSSSKGIYVNFKHEAQIPCPRYVAAAYKVINPKHQSSCLFLMNSKVIDTLVDV